MEMVAVRVVGGAWYVVVWCVVCGVRCLARGCGGWCVASAKAEINLHASTSGSSKLPSSRRNASLQPWTPSTSCMSMRAEPKGCFDESMQTTAINACLGGPSSGGPSLGGPSTHLPSSLSDPHGLRICLWNAHLGPGSDFDGAQGRISMGNWIGYD